MLQTLVLVLSVFSKNKIQIKVHLAGSTVSDFNTHTVIEFLMAKNIQPQVIQNWMTVCGEDVLSYTMAKWWVAEFRRDRTSVEVEPRSGRPLLAVCEVNCRVVESIDLHNRRVLCISTSSVKMILRETLADHEVCVRWVPQMFDQKMKDFWREASNESLKLIPLNCNLCMRRTVTDDETWLHHYKLETKDILWDAECILLVYYMQHKVAITWASLCWLLRKLLITSKEKRRGKWTEVPVLSPNSNPLCVRARVRQFPAIFGSLTARCNSLRVSGRPGLILATEIASESEVRWTEGCTCILLPP